jgi:hypothetical protein
LIWLAYLELLMVWFFLPLCRPGRHAASCGEFVPGAGAVSAEAMPVRPTMWFPRGPGRDEVDDQLSRFRSRD